jgi:hypothetical protein
MSPDLKRAWKELLTTLAVVVTLGGMMYLILGVVKPRKAKAAQEAAIDWEAERVKQSAPYALHPAQLAPTSLSRREEIRRDVVDARALLGEALVDRYLAPYDAWVDYWNPATRTAHPLDEKKARWYLLRLRAENVHAGRDVDLRFCLDPTARISWSCGDPMCPMGDNCSWHVDNDGAYTKETMDGYARRYRATLADAFARYMLDLLRESDNDARRDYRVTIVTGSARLYALHAANADASNVRALTEIK